MRYLDLPAMEGATKQVPASDVWRSTLLDAAEQLPADIPGIIAVSVEAFGSTVWDDLAAAVYGDLVAIPEKKVRTGPRTFTSSRIWNGAFAQEGFAHVAQVWVFKLQPVPASQDGEYETMCEWACNFTNSVAGRPTRPDLLAFALPNVVDHAYRNFFQPSR